MQDWQCAHSRDSEGDSGCDDSQGPESGDRPAAPVPDDRLEEPDPIEFELNQIMDTLQQNLPEIAFQGPEKPQVLGIKPSDGGCAPERSSLPVPTPCRAESRGPEVDPAMTRSSLKSLKAHEDGVIIGCLWSPCMLGWQNHGIDYMAFTPMKKI